MTDNTVETSRRSRVETEISAMLRNRQFDGLVVRLTTRFPGHRELAEDAVCHAVVKILERIERDDVLNVSAYMYQVAANYVKKTLKKTNGHESSIESIREHDEDWDPEAELTADETPGNFDSVIGFELRQALRRVVATWNDNIRVVTTLVLDHAFADDGDWMTAEDLANEAGAILGEQITPQTASMWKARGLRRIRDHFNFD